MLRERNHIAIERILSGISQGFSELPLTLQTWFRDHATLVVASKNRVLIPPGAKRPQALALSSGLLAVMHVNAGGSEVVTDFVKPGDFFNLATLPPDSPSISVVCAYSSVAASWDANIFHQGLTLFPQFGVWYLKQVEARLHSLYKDKAKLANLSGVARYAYFLWSVSEPLDETRRIVRIKIPQHLVGSYLDIGREEVSRRKAILVRRGLVSETLDGLILSSEIRPLFEQPVTSSEPTKQKEGHEAFQGQTSQTRTS